MNRVLSALFTCFAAMTFSAHAEYPERGVRIIAPFPAGQTTDVLARALAQELSETLGQPFYVDNKGGAAGIIGMEAAKRADADGYTLVMSSSGPLTINPALYETLPYDTEKDFAAIGMIGVVPQFLVTRADFPANNLQELIKHVQKNPGKLNYGSGGAGLTNHLTMEMLKTTAKLDVMHVPYRGASAALTGLIGGDTDMMFESGPAIMPHVQEGRLKVFATGSKNGSKALPQISSIDQAGVPGFDAQTWAALLAPAGTPAPIVQKLNAALADALKKPAIEKQFAALGTEVIVTTPEETDAYIKSELERWNHAVKAADVKVN